MAQNLNLVQETNHVTTFDGLERFYVADYSGGTATDGYTDAQDIPAWKLYSGGTILTMGTITDGQYLYRASTTIAGTSLPSFPSGSIVGTTDAQTLTNKRVTPRAGTIALSATPSINTDSYDYLEITGSGTITSMTSGLSGTPTRGQTLWLAFTTAGTVVVTWGASFENGASTLSGTITAPYDAGFKWQTTDSKWRLMAAG